MTFFGEPRSARRAIRHEQPAGPCASRSVILGPALRLRRLDRHRALQRISRALRRPASAHAHRQPRASNSSSASLPFSSRLKAGSSPTSTTGASLSAPRSSPPQCPRAYKLLANKYYVDEIYGAVIVKPLLAFSKYVLGWVVDTAFSAGFAWLLAGIASLSRSDSAALAIRQSALLCGVAGRCGAAAVLLFRRCCLTLGLALSRDIST